ncbi:MAG: cell division protein FtsA [Patescibacteria group bacterium]
MKPRILCGLDIGTHSIKIVIAQKKEGEGGFEILGFAEEPSAGVRKGAVVNPEEVARRILTLKDRIENLSNQKIEGVAVNIGGSHIFTIPSHGVVAVSRADGQISQEDVDRVLQAAQAISLSSNKEILDMFPQQFLVDGEGNIKGVVGMKGVRLEADVLTVCGFSPYIKNVTDAVLDAGLEIEDMVSSPLMSSPAVLTPQQKELGAAVVDIGAGTTGLAVYEEGDLIHTAIFPVGSANITNDIAIGLRAEPDIAERIKKEFGAHGGTKGKRFQIEVPGGKPLILPQKMIGHIMEARIREILQLVNKEFKKISRQGMLPGGVILVGGGSKLPQIVDIAKRELRLTVRLGTLYGVINPPLDSTFLGAMGLIMGRKDSSDQGRSTVASNLLQKMKKMFRVFVP